MYKEKKLQKAKSKKVIIGGSVFILALSFLLISDNRQQKRFYLVREGYAAMNEEHYEEAVEKFENYLVYAPHFNLYWRLYELVNGQDKYYYDSVSKVIDYCNAKKVGVYGQ